MLLLDGRRIQPECTVAQIDGLCAGQRPLGRTPKLLLEHQRPRRNGLGMWRVEWQRPADRGAAPHNGPRREAPPPRVQAPVRLLWRGLVARPLLGVLPSEAAKGEISEEGYDGDKGEGDDAPTIVEGALVATPPKPARTASGAAPDRPAPIRRAAALWSGGLPGELVRVVMNFSRSLLHPGAKEGGRARACRRQPGAPHHLIVLEPPTAQPSVGGGRGRIGAARPLAPLARGLG